MAESFGHQALYKDVDEAALEISDSTTMVILNTNGLSLAALLFDRQTILTQAGQWLYSLIVSY
jgi:hypothetical protein